jgi:drug/metabolite transporter (DMT)-like permease
VKGQSAAPYLWMLSGSLAFSVMAALAHALGASLGWQLVALARALFPLAFVTLWAVAAGVTLVLWRPRVLWMRSLAGSFSLICTFYAFTNLPPSDVMTLTNMFPVWVALLSWIFLKERPTAAVAIAIASGITGVVLVRGGHDLPQADRAVVIALVASVSTAVAMIGLHRLRGLDTRAIVVHFSLVSSVFALAALFLFDQDRPALPESLQPIDWGMFVGLGITATLGQICLTKAFATGPPSKVSVVCLTQILFALFLEVTFLGHDLDGYKLAGMFLVVTPTAWLLMHPGQQGVPPEVVGEESTLGDGAPLGPPPGSI